MATSDGKNIIFNEEPVQEHSPDTSTADAKAPANVSISSSVEIIGIDLRSEIVTINNTGSEPVDLSGWELVSQKGDQAFNFPAGTVITPGETLKVKSGPDAQAGTNSLVWTNKNIWNNQGDPGALYDLNGNTISEFPR